MREIKFRAKQITIPELESKWIYGYIAQDGFDWQILERDEESGILGDVPVHKETISQYIGIKDSHGVEIYEGDILFVCAGTHHSGSYEHQYKMQVTLKPEGLESIAHLLESEKIEIIGNIHDSIEKIM